MSDPEPSAAPEPEDNPFGAPPPEQTPATVFVTPGHSTLTIQVSPQGGVTITMLPAPALPEFAVMEASERGLGEFLFGDRQPVPVEPDEAQAAGAGGGNRESPVDKLRDALDSLRQKLADFVDDVTTLEVRTYVTDDLAEIDRLARPDQDARENAQGEPESSVERFFRLAEFRALTRIELDGDTNIVVPASAGQLDETLWRIHLETVRQAQAHREVMFKTVVELIGGLVPSVK